MCMRMYIISLRPGRLDAADTKTSSHTSRLLLSVPSSRPSMRRHYVHKGREDACIPPAAKKGQVVRTSSATLEAAQHRLRERRRRAMRVCRAGCMSCDVVLPIPRPCRGTRDGEGGKLRRTCQRVDERLAVMAMGVDDHQVDDGGGRIGECRRFEGGGAAFSGSKRQLDVESRARVRKPRA